MKKLPLLISTAVLLTAGAAGCADPCEDLAEICQLCGDADYCQSCIELVHDDNQALCDLETPTFRQFCVSTDGPSCPSLKSDAGSEDSCSNTGDCSPGSVCYHGWCIAVGELRVSLNFEVDSDFDLHVITPHGNEICWSDREFDGGELDVDQCINSCGDGVHVENVVFSESPPVGTYGVYVQNFDARGSGNFTVEVVSGDEQLTFSGTLPADTGAKSQTFTFDYPLQG